MTLSGERGKEFYLMFRIYRLHPHGKEHLFERAQPPPAEITTGDMVRFVGSLGFALAVLFAPPKVTVGDVALTLVRRALTTQR